MRACHDGGSRRSKPCIGELMARLGLPMVHADAPMAHGNRYMERAETLSIHADGGCYEDGVKTSVEIREEMNTQACRAYIFVTLSVNLCYATHSESIARLWTTGSFAGHAEWEN
jgi:hypothetical protein